MRLFTHFLQVALHIIKASITTAVQGKSPETSTIASFTSTGCNRARQARTPTRPAARPHHVRAIATARRRARDECPRHVHRDAGSPHETWRGVGKTVEGGGKRGGHHADTRRAAGRNAARHRHEAGTESGLPWAPYESGKGPLTGQAPVRRGMAQHSLMASGDVGKRNRLSDKATLPAGHRPCHSPIQRLASTF